jgi:hypothetical protein
VEHFPKGRVVWALIPDKRGVAKPDPRPAIVTQDVTTNGPDDLIPVLVCSTSFDEPLPDSQIKVWDRYGKDATSGGLYKPTVAVCDWTANLKRGELSDPGVGRLSAKRNKPAIEKMIELEGGSKQT